jgi:hypothetical protein
MSFVVVRNSTTEQPDRAIALRQPYEQRAVRPLETWAHDGWLLKVYGLVHRGDVPPSEVVAAAKRTAAETLPTPAETPDRYGVGFLIVHQGQDQRWLLVDWWGYESVLHHRLFVAPLDGEPEFERAPDPLTACVWELPILAFERDAWVETVLSDPKRPDVPAYLERRLEGRI